MFRRKIGNRMQYGQVLHDNEKNINYDNRKTTKISDEISVWNCLLPVQKDYFYSKKTLVRDQSQYTESLNAQIINLSNTIIDELEIENKAFKSQICQISRKLISMENDNSNLNKKMDHAISRVTDLDSKSHETINEVLSEINVSLKHQSDYSFRLYQESITHTNQLNSVIMDQTSHLFDILYSQIYEYIGVTDEKSLSIIKEQIRTLLSQKYEYFPG